jgi:hypothetical protein
MLFWVQDIDSSITFTIIAFKLHSKIPVFLLNRGNFEIFGGNFHSTLPNPSFSSEIDFREIDDDREPFKSDACLFDRIFERMPYCTIPATYVVGEAEHSIYYETFGNGPNKIIFNMGLGGKFSVVLSYL